MKNKIKEFVKEMIKELPKQDVEVIHHKIRPDIITSNYIRSNSTNIIKLLGDYDYDSYSVGVIRTINSEIIGIYVKCIYNGIADTVDYYFTRDEFFAIAEAENKAIHNFVMSTMNSVINNNKKYIKGAIKKNKKIVSYKLNVYEIIEGWDYDWEVLNYMMVKYKNLLISFNFKVGR